MNNFKILGGGCANCNNLEQMVKEICEENKVEAVFEKVKEYQDILSYGVMATPGLVVNGVVLHSGKLPTKEKLSNINLEAVKK